MCESCLVVRSMGSGVYDFQVKANLSVSSSQKGNLED